jgi:hypothetical protein
MLVDFSNGRMETTNFNLHQTIDTITTAFEAVICHMLFDFAVHGFVMAFILALIAAFLSSRKSLYAMCIFRVVKRISIFSLLVSVPGLLSLIINRHLPNAGVFNFNSIGLLSFWSLISVHLVFEEINNTIVRQNRITEAE